jgi:hypothetical protein
MDIVFILDNGINYGTNDSKSLYTGFTAKCAGHYALNTFKIIPEILVTLPKYFYRMKDGIITVI